MRNLLTLSVRLVFCAVWFQLALSCKSKEEPEPTPVSATIISFSVEGEIAKSVIDNVNLTITLRVDEDFNWTRTKVNYTVSDKASILVGQERVTSGSTVDFSEVNEITLRHTNGEQKKYKILHFSIWTEYGLGMLLQGGKSNNKSYSYYLDQYGSGTHQYINCGPAVVAMAMRWADSTQKKEVSEVRGEIRPEGGWWYTSDIYNYLREYGLNPGYTSLSVNLTQMEYERSITDLIDNDFLAVLCLDMYYVQKNYAPDQRTNCFYNANSLGWGHFILVKGYKVVDGKVWLETYDPYSIGNRYIDGQLKGQDRYYDPIELKRATDIWWPMAIVIPQKGNAVNARFKVHEKEVPVQKGRGF